MRAVLAVTCVLAVIASVAAVQDMMPMHDKIDTVKLEWDKPYYFNETVPKSDKKSLGDAVRLDFPWDGQVPPEFSCLSLLLEEAVLEHDGLAFLVHGEKCEGTHCSIYDVSYTMRHHLGEWKVYMQHIGSTDIDKDPKMKIERAILGVFSDAGRHMIAGAKLSHQGRLECIIGAEDAPTATETVIAHKQES